RSLLDAGVTVIGVDLLYQGEFLADERPNKQQRWLPGEDAFAGWTYCYNLPLFARRVQDILAVIAWGKRDDLEPNEVDVVGLHGSGPLVAAAVAQAQGSVARAAINTAGFRFADVKDVYDVNFMPGAAKYDDLPGLLALSVPTQLWLAGEGDKAPSIVNAAFAVAGKGENLETFSGEARDAAKVAVEWLLH
ncbi:MAG: acetylxylan esterase, partial [Planctomycetota bacterium]